MNTKYFTIRKTLILPLDMRTHTTLWSQSNGQRAKKSVTRVVLATKGIIKKQQERRKEEIHWKGEKEIIVEKKKGKKDWGNTEKRTDWKDRKKE